LNTNSSVFKKRKEEKKMGFEKLICLFSAAAFSWRVFEKIWLNWKKIKTFQNRKTHAIPRLLGYVPLSLWKRKTKKKCWKKRKHTLDSQMHKTIFFSHLCIRIHSDFCFEIVFLYTFFFLNIDAMRAYFFDTFTCFLDFYKELTLLQ